MALKWRHSVRVKEKEKEQSFIVREKRLRLQSFRRIQNVRR